MLFRSLLLLLILGQIFLSVEAQANSHLSTCAGWLSQEYISTSSSEEIEGLSRANLGRTKPERLYQIQELVNDLEKQVPGKTIQDPRITHTERRMIPGQEKLVEIGSISAWFPALDSSNSTMLRLHGDTVEDYRGKKIFTLLVANRILAHPEVAVISSTLAGTNAEIISKELRNGLTLEEALKKTPAWKVREKLGFTEILYVKSTGSDQGLRVELDVGRPLNEVEH